MFTSKYFIYHIIAGFQETDQDETDLLEQPRITSTALKMQMTLRSMIDLGMHVLNECMYLELSFSTKI